MIGHSFLMGSVPITFFLWLVIVGSFFLITPFLIIGYTSFQQLEEYRLSNEGMEAQSDTIASILKYRKRIFQSIVIVLLSSFVIFISWTVNMSKRDIPNYISPDIKLARDLITAPGDTSLLLSLVPGKKGPFTLCPEFDNRIRRYSWVPQSERDVLTLVPKYDDAVIAVSLNERTIPKSGPIKIPGNKPGKEYKISLRSGDESKSADYVVVVLPTSFIPLQVKSGEARECGMHFLTQYIHDLLFLSSLQNRLIHLFRNHNAHIYHIYMYLINMEHHYSIKCPALAFQPFAHINMVSTMVPFMNTSNMLLV